MLTYELTMDRDAFDVFDNTGKRIGSAQRHPERPVRFVPVDNRPLTKSELTAILGILEKIGS